MRQFFSVPTIEVSERAHGPSDHVRSLVARDRLEAIEKHVAFPYSGWNIFTPVDTAEHESVHHAARNTYEKAFATDALDRLSL